MSDHISPLNRGLFFACTSGITTNRREFMKPKQYKVPTHRPLRIEMIRDGRISNPNPEANGGVTLPYRSAYLQFLARVTGRLLGEDGAPL